LFSLALANATLQRLKTVFTIKSGRFVQSYVGEPRSMYKAHVAIHHHGLIKNPKGMPS